MAPPGPGTMAQVCTLGYCHRANAGRAASRTAQLEQVTEPRLPWLCPSNAQKEGEADGSPLKEPVWEGAQGRGLHASLLTGPLRTPSPPLSLPFCHLLLSLSA